LAGQSDRWTITISRQLGSHGMLIAHCLGDQLGYQVVWREVINQAARRAGAPEAALAAIDELGLLGICPSPQACLAYRQAVEQVMHELAAAGQVVIVGRAGQTILSGAPRTLHVRTIAPTACRVGRVAARNNISPKAAKAQVEVSDRFRKNYLKRFYNVCWDAPELYNLVINTESIRPDQAAEIIAHTLELFQQASLSSSDHATTIG
jgi:cytidylate kinase